MKMGNKLKKIISIQNQKDERIALNYLKIITTSKKKKQNCESLIVKTI